MQPSDTSALRPPPLHLARTKFPPTVSFWLCFDSSPPPSRLLHILSWRCGWNCGRGMSPPLAPSLLGLFHSFSPSFLHLFLCDFSFFPPLDAYRRLLLTLVLLYHCGFLPASTNIPPHSCDGESTVQQARPVPTVSSCPRLPFRHFTTSLS